MNQTIPLGTPIDNYIATPAAAVVMEPAPKSYAQEAMDGQKKVEKELQAALKKAVVVPNVRKVKSVRCNTMHIKAEFKPAPEHSHGRAELIISDGDGIATLKLSGQAAKSLHKMLKQVFE